MINIIETPVTDKSVYVSELQDGSPFLYDGSLYIKTPFKAGHGMCVMFLGTLEKSKHEPIAFSARDFNEWNGIKVEPVDIDITVNHK